MEGKNVESFVILDQRTNTYASFDGVFWYQTRHLQYACKFPTPDYAKECFKVTADHLILPYSIEKREIIEPVAATNKKGFVDSVKIALHNVKHYLKSISRDDRDNRRFNRYKR